MPDRKDPIKDSEAGEYELDDDAAEASAEAPPAGPGSETAAVVEELAKLQAESDELRQTLIRLQADFSNYRKRIERERHEGGQRAIARLLEELLPVLDAFERALAAHDDSAYQDYRKGFELIYRQLWDAMSRQGLARIEAEGKPFDPHVHQAVERVESEDHADGTVVEVMQPGYLLGDRVLRPAVVRVAVHSSGKHPEAQKNIN